MGADDRASGSGIQNAFLRFARGGLAQVLLRPESFNPDPRAAGGEAAGLGQLLGGGGITRWACLYGLPDLARRWPLDPSDAACRVDHKMDLPPAFKR